MSERPSDEATIDAAVASDDADGRAYHVKLPMFEGPLDLLLHLIQKHELNILEIPIGFVAQKYVEYIRMMEEMSIDIASEYLVMAATLAYIKSRELLPPDPSQAADETAEEEEEDPRAELIRKLLEYQKYKHAADNLGDREVLGRDVFARGLAPDQSDEEAPLAPMSLFKLVDAFEGVLKRAKQVQEHQIDFEKVSISDRVGQIVERLRLVRTLRFEQLFDGDITRPEMIVTFLALLEMTKLRMTRLTQDGPLGPIVVELVLSAEQVRNFDADRAFDSVSSIDEDFAAPKPWPSPEDERSPEPSPWEGNSDELELSEEELAEELREAAQAFALDEQEPRQGDVEASHDKAVELASHDKAVSDGSVGSPTAGDGVARVSAGHGVSDEFDVELDRDRDESVTSLEAEADYATPPLSEPVPESDPESGVGTAGQLATFGPPDVDDFAGPEWDDAARTSEPEAKQDVKVAPDLDVSPNSAGFDESAEAAAGEATDLVGGPETPDQAATNDEAGADEPNAASVAVSDDEAVASAAEFGGSTEAESEPSSDGFGADVDATSAQDVIDAEFGAQGPEPETGGRTDDVQEGSQDPRGSDVESP